jgi:hypothetical protein
MVKTLLDLTTQLNMELDLETEDFVQPQELIGYWNHAIREAEAHILKLGLKDKYFRKKALISLVNGQSTYDLPSDIYSDKIIKLVYRNGTTIYALRPIDTEGEDQEEAEELINLDQAVGYYKYDVVRSTDGTTSLVLYPDSVETTTDAIRIHYYRDANTLVNDDDICDLPEIAYEFIHARVKVYCYEKEIGHMNMPIALAQLSKMEALMIATLEQQIVDSEFNKLNQDHTHYEEST